MGILKRILKRMEHWQLVAMLLVIYDVIAVNVAYFLALWLRFDLSFNEIQYNYLNAFIAFAPIYKSRCKSVQTL